MTKDLGTWHLRVEFEDGSGYIHEWHTGRRFSNGSHATYPLTAFEISPAWENEKDLLQGMEYIYVDGNYACDCNLRLFLDRANQKEGDHEGYKCGDTLKLKQLTALAPDGRQIVIYPERVGQSTQEQG